MQIVNRKVEIKTLPNSFLDENIGKGLQEKIDEIPDWVFVLSNILKPLVSPYVYFRNSFESRQ